MDKGNIQINIFFLFLHDNIVGTHWKSLGNMLHISTHYISFHRDITKTACGYPLLSGVINKRLTQINIFLFLYDNIHTCCQYSLEGSWQIACNEDRQCMFLWRNKKYINIFKDFFVAK